MAWKFKWPAPGIRWLMRHEAGRVLAELNIQGRIKEGKSTTMNKLSRTLVPRAVVFIVFALLTLSHAPSEVSAQGKNTTAVRAFVGAFNERKLDAMLAPLEENFQWLSVDGAKVTIVTEGKKALRESLESYFRSCPSCRSTLEWVRDAGSRVTAMERASWRSKTGPKSQRGLSVYEFQNGKILRVYYFQVDTDAPGRLRKVEGGSE